MSWPMNYGRLWGQIPSTAGQVHWVAPADSYTVNGQAYSASNNNDGLDPTRALRTVNQAWTNAVANAGDVIVLLPGTHTPSVSIAASKAGVTMMGLPGGQGNFLLPKATISGVVGDQLVNVTGTDIEIAHINFIPDTAVAAVDIASAAARTYIHHCGFDLATPAASTSTLGIDALGAAQRTFVENCFFQSGGAQGPGIDMTATQRWLVRDCYFLLLAGTWAAAITCGAGASGATIQRCVINDGAGTAITAGIDGTGATIANGVSVVDCRFGVGVTVPIDNFDAGECQIAENYDFGIGAADGGALITAIT